MMHWQGKSTSAALHTVSPDAYHQFACAYIHDRRAAHHRYVQRRYVPLLLIKRDNLDVRCRPPWRVRQHSHKLNAKSAADGDASGEIAGMVGEEQLGMGRVVDEGVVV